MQLGLLMLRSHDPKSGAWQGGALQSGNLCVWWIVNGTRHSAKQLLLAFCVLASRLVRELTQHTRPGMQRDVDLRHLKRSIELADEAVREGNHPFGAVLVSQAGEVLAEGKNSYSVDRGPGHAEANLARDAARRFDGPTLLAATLYTSVEPCSMCSGTIYWADIGAVVFGMTERRLGELTGDDPENQTQDLECRVIFASGRRPVPVRGPFPELEDRIAAQHMAFWKAGGVS